MQLKIVVNTGDEAGTSMTVAAGQTLRVGRTQPAELRLPGDSLLSSVHFSLNVLPESCQISDLGSKFGTSVNGQKVQQSELADGDVIEAGRTKFLVTIAGLTSSSANHRPLTEDPASVPLQIPAQAIAPPAPLGQVQSSVLTYFQNLAATGTVYGIMDAAREPMILTYLNKHGEQCQSLYEGEPGEALAPFGPWLVRLPGHSALLSELIGQGWGNSWGIYLASSLPFAEVRKHFRRFLRVKIPDGRQVYFRYYDPRVLRTYLASSMPHEQKEFFGSIQRFVLEMPEGEGILEYSPHSKNPKSIVLA